MIIAPLNQLYATWTLIADLHGPHNDVALLINKNFPDGMSNVGMRLSAHAAFHAFNNACFNNDLSNYRTMQKMKSVRLRY